MELNNGIEYSQNSHDQVSTMQSILTFDCGVFSAQL
jgi:hypothetical protein